MATAKDLLVEKAAALAPSAPTLRDFLASQKGRIAQALPHHMTAERMLTLVMHSVLTTRHLADCTPASVITCVMDCAALGLEPGPLGRVYLVPRYNGRRGAYEAGLIIGYRGMVELARRSGEVSTVAAHEVYAADDFSAEYGLDPVLRHRPRWADRTGEPILYYAVVRLADGQSQFDVMTAAEVDAIRRRSASRDDGPWATDPIEMGKKTVLRRLMKLIPMAVDVAETIERVDTEGLDLTPHLSALEGSFAAPMGAGEPPAPHAPETETPKPKSRKRAAPAAEADAPPPDDPPGEAPAPPTAAPAEESATGPTLTELRTRLEEQGATAADLRRWIADAVGEKPGNAWTDGDREAVRRRLAEALAAPQRYQEVE